jgi:nucleotide-binding universal stress UspA family protein
MALQHILVPTDFSACAEQALDYAIAFATRLRARVTLIHVISPVFWGAGEATVAPPPTYFAELEAAAEQDIEAALKHVRAAGLEGQTMVVHGFPFESILTAARDQGVDLIIMGTHGRTGLPHILIGSVAERVVRLAPCPVLVTRATMPAAEGT